MMADDKVIVRCGEKAEETTRTGNVFRVFKPEALRS